MGADAKNHAEQTEAVPLPSKALGFLLKRRFCREVGSFKRGKTCA